MNQTANDIHGVYWGRDPEADARIEHFLTENDLDYLLNPYKNASPEQLRFMIAADESRVFAPCADEVFRQLLEKNPSGDLNCRYSAAWRVFLGLTREHVEEPYLRKRLLAFARHVFKQTLYSHVVIPSRLMKRLNSIFLTRSGQTDPYRERKLAQNRRALALTRDPLFDRLMNACPEDEKLVCTRLSELRFELDLIEIKRLLFLSVWADAWDGEKRPTAADFAAELAKPCPGIDVFRDLFGPERHGFKRILYIPAQAGGLVFDLMLIRLFIRQGHQVALALKDGFHFQSPTIDDALEDPTIVRFLETAHITRNDRVAKNALIKDMREHRLVVFSDGTAERLNLHRVNTTFARAWKEADLVIAKGEANHRRLILNSTPFTRDVLVFHRDREGRHHCVFKPKPQGFRKITEADLTALADAVILKMRGAREAGKTIMFYSAIVGSIPGHTKTAIRLLNTFVGRLRQKNEHAFIINPAEHFLPGMDGDDLMFMWERVQRSGLIDVWRFQTAADIEEGFESLGEKVPSAWLGKDATFSTGCTKEMRIALDVQVKRPEMQILGPEPMKFFRRGDYGVGKYHDAALKY